MRLKQIFIINSVIAVGYALAFFVATGPVLAVYGIAPNPEGTFMARWFGVGLLAIGLTTWLARHDADSPVGRAVARALAVSYGVGVVLASWGTLIGPFNQLGWIAVGFNLLLSVGFTYAGFKRQHSPNGADWSQRISAATADSRRRGREVPP